MSKSKEYNKHIFCIESEFNNNLVNDSTCRHMLEQLTNLHRGKLKFIYRKCATKTELMYYIKKMSLKKYKDFSIIYFCLHGNENHIYFGNESISLNELSEIVGDALKDKIVHFGSCETIKVSQTELKKFMIKTNSLLVSGFTTEVDFTEAIALEILFFDWCQEFKETKSIERRMLKFYDGLVERTGFKMFHKTNQ